MHRALAVSPVTAACLGDRCGDQRFEHGHAQIGESLDVQAGFADPVFPQRGEARLLRFTSRIDLHDEVLAA